MAERERLSLKAGPVRAARLKLDRLYSHLCHSVTDALVGLATGRRRKRGRQWTRRRRFPHQPPAGHASFVKGV